MNQSPLRLKTHHIILSLVRAALVILAAHPVCGKPEAGETPNILFILADDLGYGDLGCEPDRKHPLNGAFLAANIEIATTGGGPRHKTCMYLSGPDDVTHVAMKKNAAALGVRYTLRKPYINSSMTPDVPPSSWPARQVWLFTPQGMAGLVEVTSTRKQTAAGINGELRFGPNAPLKKVRYNRET